MSGDNAAAAVFSNGVFPGGKEKGKVLNWFERKLSQGKISMCASTPGRFPGVDFFLLLDYAYKKEERKCLHER